MTRIIKGFVLSILHSGETHLTGHSVRAELAEAQWRLDPPQKSHHIKVLYPAPKNPQTVKKTTATPPGTVGQVKNELVLIKGGAKGCWMWSEVFRSLFLWEELTWLQGRIQTRSV